MKIGQTVTLKKGSGYWLLDDYPWGGCFRRAEAAITGNILQIVNYYREGKPRDLVLQSEWGGRLLGVRADNLAEWEADND